MVSIQTLPNRISFAPTWENAKEIRENYVACRNYHIQHSAERHWDEAFLAHKSITNIIPLTGQFHLLYAGEEHAQNIHRNSATGTQLPSSNSVDSKIGGGSFA